jgi:quinol monooxygenase YgiN
MLILAGTIDLHPDDLAAFLSSVKLVSAASRAEPGNVAYVFSRDLDDSNRLCLFEAWKDRAALDAHLKEPHFLAHRERIAKLRAKRDLATYDAGEPQPF